MVQAVAAFRNQALFWNVSAAVGPGQPNKMDDVELVRLSYFLAKDNPKFTSGDFAVMKPILQKVTTTGAFDNALAEAIRTHERLRGGAQDGKVSVAKANDFNRGRYDREHSWLVFPLNNNLIDMAGNLYPRLDLHPQCGPALKAVVRKICLHE
jgi:hypothetical protein